MLKWDKHLKNLAEDFRQSVGDKKAVKVKRLRKGNF